MLKLAAAVGHSDDSLIIVVAFEGSVNSRSIAMTWRLSSSHTSSMTRRMAHDKCRERERESVCRLSFFAGRLHCYTFPFLKFVLESCQFQFSMLPPSPRTIILAGGVRSWVDGSQEEDSKPAGHDVGSAPTVQGSGCGMRGAPESQTATAPL